MASKRGGGGTWHRANPTCTHYLSISVYLKPLRATFTANALRRLSLIHAGLNKVHITCYPLGLYKAILRPKIWPFDSTIRIAIIHRPFCRFDPQAKKGKQPRLCSMAISSRRAVGIEIPVREPRRYRAFPKAGNSPLLADIPPGSGSEIPVAADSLRKKLGRMEGGFFHHAFHFQPGHGLDFYINIKLLYLEGAWTFVNS